ncbi:TPA: hypothetical protein ACIVL5_003575 [Salmonella enterica subsp. diarizonae serovar 61:r:-]
MLCKKDGTTVEHCRLPPVIEGPGAAKTTHSNNVVAGLSLRRMVNLTTRCPIGYKTDKDPPYLPLRHFADYHNDEGIAGVRIERTFSLPNPPD